MNLFRLVGVSFDFLVVCVNMGLTIILGGAWEVAVREVFRAASAIR
jgi:hypothetical protein